MALRVFNLIIKISFQRLSRNRKYEPYLVKPVISTISENDWHSFVLLLVLNMSKLMMYGIKVLKTVITSAHSNAKILKGTLKVTASSVINHKILHPSLKISLILERLELYLELLFWAVPIRRGDDWYSIWNFQKKALTQYDVTHCSNLGVQIHDSEFWWRII